MCTYAIILVHSPLMTVVVGGNGKSTRRNHEKWRARCIGGGIYHDHPPASCYDESERMCSSADTTKDFIISVDTKHVCMSVWQLTIVYCGVCALVRGLSILTNPASYLWRNDWQQTNGRSNITDTMMRVNRIPALPPPSAPLTPDISGWAQYTRYRFTYVWGGWKGGYVIRSSYMFNHQNVNFRCVVLLWALAYYCICNSAKFSQWYKEFNVDLFDICVTHSKLHIW